MVFHKYFFLFFFLFICSCKQPEKEDRYYDLVSKNAIANRIIKVEVYKKTGYDSTVVYDNGYARKQKYYFLSFINKQGQYIKVGSTWKLMYSFQSKEINFLSFDTQYIPFVINSVQLEKSKTFPVKGKDVKVYRYSLTATAHDYDYHFFSITDGMIINYNPYQDTYLKNNAPKLQELITAVVSDTSFFPKSSRQLLLEFEKDHPDDVKRAKRFWSKSSKEKNR